MSTTSTRTPLRLSDTVFIHICPISVCGQCQIRVLQQVVLEIQNRAFSADKQDRIPVIQQSHLVRRHQLPPGVLIVGGEVSAHTVAFTVGIRVDSGFAEQFGHIFVCALLVPSEIDKFVTVADNGLPLLLKKSFELREVLQDNADRYTAGTHDRENFIKVIGKRKLR